MDLWQMLAAEYYCAPANAKEASAKARTETVKMDVHITQHFLTT
jgi:hypothetical protein